MIEAAEDVLGETKRRVGVRSLSGVQGVLYRSLLTPLLAASGLLVSACGDDAASKVPQVLGSADAGQILTSAPRASGSGHGTATAAIKSAAPGTSSAPASDVEAGSVSTNSEPMLQAPEMDSGSPATEPSGNVGASQDAGTGVVERLVPLALPVGAGNGLAGASSVSYHDLDGDGDLDLLVGAYGSGEVVWVRNDAGKFLVEQPVASGLPATWNVAAADLDADGDIDVVAGGYAGRLNWYENDGSGAFIAVALDEGVIGPTFALEDFDGDGLVDIIAGPVAGSGVYLYRGTSEGFATREVLVAAAGVAGVKLHDLDGDGQKDLVIGGGGGNSVAWYINQGAGVLGEKHSVAGLGYVSVNQLADFNGDGQVDVLSLDPASSQLAWFPGTSEGGFAAPVQIQVPVDGIYTVKVADLNQDNAPDLVVGSFSPTSSALVWLANLGEGTFGVSQLISQRLGQLSSIETGDTDGDGDPDLVVASFSDARAWQIENRQGQSATEFVPLGAGTYVKGQQLQPVLHFGVPLNVHGTPTLSLRIGNRVAKAKYLGLDGEMALRFGCDLLESDSDSDGIELASTELERAGGTVTDALGRTVNLSLPPLSASGVLVAGSAPYVESITRADGTPSSRQRVSFYVHFSKPVSSVDLQDFTLRSSGGLSGASLDLVAANGRDVYVGVNTGRGSGTLQLAIADSATIQDANGIALVNGYQGGEVYTLDRNPPRSIETYYTQGHGDLTPVFANEQWSTEVRTGQTQTVQNLLIVGGNSALTTRPSAEQFGFLGVAAGEALYVWPASGMPNIPQLGFGGAGIPAGVLASYQHPDPRVNALGQWVDMRVVGLRSSSAGALSLYTTDVFGQSKVWIATADGITDVDKLVFAAGSHQHFNFAFSKAGTYELDVVFSGYRDRNGNGQREAVDPYIESGVTTLYFAVDTASSPVPYRVRGAVEKACNVTRYPLEAGNLLLHSRHTDVFTLEADCTDAKQPQLVMSTSYDSLSGGDFKEHHRFEDVLLYASPVNQLVGFPELTNPNKSLLAAQTGDTVWMFPEGAPDDTALPWPGLQSYNIPQGLFYDDDVQMELVGVDGPVGSAVQLFYSPQDELSPFDFKFDSSRSLAPWTVPGGTHVHLNWLFTHAGLYRMNFRLKSTLVDGTTVQSQQKTLKVWVGDIALLPSSEPTQFKVEGVDGAGVNGSTLLTAVTYGRPPASTELIRWYKQCVYYAAQPAVQGAWTVAGEGSTLDVVRFTAEDGLASCAYRALLHDSGGAVLARSQAFGQ